MVSFSSGHSTVSVALPSASDVAPVAGSTAEMTAVPGPAALTKAPPGESGLPPPTATVSSLERQSTRGVQSSLPPVARYAVAVNCARSPAIAVSVCGDPRSPKPGEAGSSGGDVGAPGPDGGTGSDGALGGAGGAGSAGVPGPTGGDTSGRSVGTQTACSVRACTRRAPRGVETVSASARGPPRDVAR